MRPTVAQIDLSALRSNLRVVQKLVGADVGIIPVVKADAYGHGAVTAAWVLAEAGIELMAVATLGEAMDIIEAGVPARFLILGGIYEESSLMEVPANCIPVVWDKASIELAASLPSSIGRPQEIHLKVDTGMCRLGCEAGEVPGLFDVAAKHPHIRITGVFSHMSSADGRETDDEDFSRKQINDFGGLSESLPKGTLTHLAGSAALIKYPGSHFDAVRPGLMIYGIWPFENDDPVNGVAPGDLEPVMSLKTKVMAVREVEAGTPVGYGRTYSMEKPGRIAVLPVGYADGVNRHLSNKGQVIIGGKRRNILGSVTMDYIMVDATEDPQVKIDSEAVMLGKQGGEEITVWELARWAETIPYEVTCAVSSRVPRLVVDDYNYGD